MEVALQHILISKATKRPYRKIPDLPENSRYDEEKGYWIIDGSPLVHTKQFADGMVSKKCDQETGEDQKGE